jgi:hypothetical protein
VDALATHCLDLSFHVVELGHGGGGPITHLFFVRSHLEPDGHVGDGVDIHNFNVLSNIVPLLQGDDDKQLLVFGIPGGQVALIGFVTQLRRVGLNT